MATRRSFVTFTLFSAFAWLMLLPRRVFAARVREHDVFSWLQETNGRFDITRYRGVLGAASEFKEGDAAIGVAAPDEATRQLARTLLGNTRISDLLAHPVHQDAISAYADAAVDDTVQREVADWTMSRLRSFLLESDEQQIRHIMPGLASDVISSVVKLMSNDELIAVSRKIRHQRREHAKACAQPHRPIRAVLRDGPGRRRHERPRPWLRHGDA